MYIIPIEIQYHSKGHFNGIATARNKKTAIFIVRSERYSLSLEKLYCSIYSYSPIADITENISAPLFSAANVN